MTGSTSDNCITLDRWFNTDVKNGYAVKNPGANIIYEMKCEIRSMSDSWFDRWKLVPYLDCPCELSSR